MAGFKEVLTTFKDTKITARNLDRVLSDIQKKVDANIGKGISKEYADKVRTVILPGQTVTKLQSMIRNAVNNSTDAWACRRPKPKKTEEPES